MKPEQSSFTDRITPGALPWIGFIFAILFYSLSGAPIFKDADVGWHITTGEWIIDNAEIPDRNIFPALRDSWENGEPYIWYNLSWAYDVFISLVHEFFGFYGLAWFSIIVSSIVIMLIMRECVRRRAGFIPSIIAVLCAALVLHSGVIARPQLVSFLMAALFYKFLRNDGNDRGAASTVRSKMPPPSPLCSRWGKPIGRANTCGFTLPLLMIIWVNSHGAFIVGLVLPAFFLVEAVWERDWNKAKTLCYASMLLLAATLMNPWGYGIYAGISRSVGSYTAQYVAEWQSVQFIKHLPVTVYVMAVIVSARFTSPTIKLADKLLVLFWLPVGLYSIRYMHMAVIITAPCLALFIRESLEAGRWSQCYQAKNQEFMADMSKQRVQNIAAGISLALVLLLALPLIQKMALRKEVGFSASNSPRQELKYIRDHLADKKFFTDYNLGGFIIFETSGTFPVFVDGRAETAYSKELMQDYFNIIYASADWQKLMDKYTVEAALIGKNIRLTEFLGASPDWRIAYEGQAAVVFVKNSHRNYSQLQ